jgi:penicillin-binding protein 1A
MSDAAHADKASPTGPRWDPLRNWPGWARNLLRVSGWAVGFALSAAVTLITLLAIALSVAYPNLPDIAGLSDYRPKLPLRVISADGVLLGEFGEERRQFTPIGQIPKAMKDAVLAIEDTAFYEHGGVDYKGVLRAAIASLSEFKSQGASTITMQLARNFYLSTEKTFTRKIYEILLALKIESQLSKEQILEVYMNQIYLGQRAYGFGAASEVYFGKPLHEITVAEAAMLAGLPRAPSAHNPVTNPRRAKARQQYIIDRMAANGYITVEQAEAARQQTLRYRTAVEAKPHAQYVAETVRQLIYSQYGEQTYSRGLNVYVTINAAEQEVAYRALRRGLMDYERRQVYRGPEAYVDLPSKAKDIDARIAEALADHPDNDELLAAVVVEASAKRVVAVLQSGESITVTGDGLKPVASGLSERGPPKSRIRPGAVVRVVKGAKNDWSLTQQPEVEGAFVSMQPTDGQIRALVGGFDFDKSKFNHVTQAWRQPGSSFKPFIYSAALERGFTPLTIINDAPLFFDATATGSQPWEPKNYDGKFEGPMPLKQALAKSKNMVSIRILQAIGPTYAQDWITRFGFEPEKHPAYLTMALGSGAVTPLQMAGAYSVFANGGFRVNPVLISRVTDSRGRVVQETKPQVLDASARMIDARNAFMMTQLLREVTRTGTAARAASLRRPDIAGKTGTTNDSLDAWFAGYQPDLVAVTWIGYDTPRKLGDRETGGTIALPVWMEYMSSALKTITPRSLPPPEGVALHGSDWMYEEFGPGAGVTSLGMEDQLPPQAPSEDERKGILDLFKR